jgi:uncharacterized protein HemX
MMYVKSSLSQRKGSKNPASTYSMGVPMQYASEMKSTESTTKSKPGRKGDSNKEKSKSKVSSGKLILLSLVLGAAGLLYLNHVYAVQQHYKEVLQLQREYEKTRRLYSDRKFTYDRMVGPAEVYDRAKVLGLQDGGPADGIIYLDK